VEVARSMTSTAVRTVRYYPTDAGVRHEGRRGLLPAASALWLVVAAVVRHDGSGPRVASRLQGSRLPRRLERDAPTDVDAGARPRHAARPGPRRIRSGAPLVPRVQAIRPADGVLLVDGRQRPSSRRLSARWPGHRRR